MAQPSGGLEDSKSQAPSSASSSRLQRGIPSFKLSDDELARSKRFRNRVPSDGSRDGAGSNEGGGPTPTTTMEGTPAPGPRSVSSFTLASDVFRMSHNSSWGSGTGSNFFGFGLASVDGEGEDAVQRLDDATFNDLNFFTMEGIGPSDLPETEPRATSGPGLDTKPTDTRSSTDGGGPDRYSIESGGTHGGLRSDRLQPAVAKEEKVVPAIVDGTGSASNILRRASSARDVLRAGSMSGRDSNRDFLEGNVFDLEGGLPTFSTAMEEYLNRQLEAAEHSLDDPAGDERDFGCLAGARDSGAGVSVSGGTGGTGAEGHLGVAGRAGASPIQNPTRSVVVKPECRRSRGASDGVLQGTTYSQCTQGEAGGLETKAAERRTRCKRGTQKQKQKRSKHETKSESDEYADSSQSEYEPPTCTPREGKATKGRGRRRGAAATTATRAAKTGSGSSGVRTASVSSAFHRRGGSLKRQTSEDVAARLPLEVLECFYHVPLNVAAQQLNVSLTMLKKLCRAYGVKRWPHRQVSSLDKTTSKLEDKIKTRRDGGKDAPSLVRKLTQARKRRKVIIKTASAGLDASVLNSIFTCRPGDIDEDMLLSSTDVAKAVEKVQFRQEADHKGSGAESDSAAGDNSNSSSDSDDDDDVESYGPRAKPPSPPPPAAAKKTTRIRAVFAATPAFSSKPPAVAKSVASPPPAFEPGGRSKSAATPRPGVEPGNKTAGNKPTSGSLGSGGKLYMKAGRPAELAKKKKGDAPMTAKGRKGVTAAAARSMSSAGRRASFPPKKGTAATAAAAAAVAAAASPVSLLSDGSSLNSPSGGSSANPTAACSPVDPTSPVFSIGRPPHNRAPMTSYSGVFGVGLNHTTSSKASSRGGDPTAFTRLRSVGGSSGQTPVSAQATAGECASSHVHQAARAPAWIGGGGGKRAKGSYGEWRGGALRLRSSPSQQHLSDASSDSPTTTATLDSFDLKLSLESPPRGPPQASPPQPPPPPQPPLPHHSHHPYLLHHPLLHHHHHHPSFQHLNWAAGGWYPGPPPPPPPQQQLYRCPIDTSFSPPQHGPGSRGFHAFSKVDDSREAAGTGAHRGAGDDASRPPDNKKSGGVSTGSTAAAAAAVAAAAAAAAAPAAAAAAPAAAAPAPAPAPVSSTSQDAEPRRTGFMSYLLHQAPQSPPLGPSSSPPAPPAPPSPLAALAGGGGASTAES